MGKFRKPSGPAGAGLLLPGTDAPTAARVMGLAALWGAHTFLSMAKEKCAKESQRHGDSRGGPRRYAPWASVCGSPSGCPRPRLLRSPAGKKPFTAHFDGGARNVARNLVGQLTPSPVRAPVLTFFRRQNERAFFPPLPIAALLPRSWRGADLKICGLGCYGVGWMASLYP